MVSLVGASALSGCSSDAPSEGWKQLEGDRVTVEYPQDWATGAQVAAGMKFGFDMSSSSSEAEAVYAAYMGAPRGGERSMVPYDDCA